MIYFGYFSFFSIHLELKRQIRWYAPVVPLKAIPDLRSNNGKNLYPFSDQNGSKTIIKYQRSESTAVMMYTSLHGMTPEYLTSRFVFRNDITSYRLRNTENKLALPQPRTNYLKKSFSYSRAGLWNSLSGNLRAATSLNNFKLNLCHHSFEWVLTRHPCKAAFSM